VGVAFGLLYRISAVILFVTFTYTFLADAGQFQNHFYLMSLISFLLILIPAHRSFSVDSVLVPDKASGFIPNWCRVRADAHFGRHAEAEQFALGVEFCEKPAFRFAIND